MTEKIPPYIEKAGIVDVPLDFIWKGPQSHIGPVETVNKRFNDIGYKTTCGMLTQAAGIIGWGAWRLKGHTDVTVLLQMVEASFAFQAHPHYFNRKGAPTRRPPNTPPAESAAAELQLLLWEGLNADTFWPSYYQPHDSAYHSSYLVRYIMPKNKQRLFSKWLDGMLERMKLIASKPKEIMLSDWSESKKEEYKDLKIIDVPSLSEKEKSEFFARHWGQPLPPQALDLEFQYQPSDRVELVNQFLSELDWKANPFLRSPEEMKALGFEGTPYKL